MSPIVHPYYRKEFAAMERRLIITATPDKRARRMARSARRRVNVTHDGWLTS